ncbi:MAG: murein biosynthesis integral membrane protein MurJ [Planctomycetia bacterium]|nr:MAG: murein biosynthesis integral membrane protein MurJ [Planctomycetia bacterium]
MNERRTVLSSARRIAACTLASRVTGMVRDVLLAQTFALSWVQDAFSYAFTIPNLFRRLFGEGGLAPVFVPRFTRALEQDGREAAVRLFHRALAVLTVTLVAVVMLLEVVILGVWLLGGGGDGSAARGLLLGLSALTLPFMVSICVLSLLAALLNCVGSFVPAAAAPIVLNLFMIAGIAWVGPALGGSAPERQVYWVAAMVLAGGVAQVLMLLPVLRRRGVPIGWQWAPRDPAVAGMMKMMVPIALGQSVLALGVFIDSQLCVLLTRTAGSAVGIEWFGGRVDYPLEEGALSALSIAQRLYQFPLGVLVISIATAALPAFSRHAVREDWRAWGGEVRQLLRMAIFEGLLAGAMMVAMAPQLIRLLFEYRNFDAADTQRTAVVLAWYGLGMWAFCAQHIVSRAFYSLGDAVTPLRISAAVLPLNVLLSLSLVWVPGLREAGLAVSSVISFGLAAIVGLLLLARRRRDARIGDGLASALVRMIACGVIAGGAVWAAAPAAGRMAEAAMGAGVWGRCAETFGLLAIGGGVYLSAAVLLRLEEGIRLLRVSRARR